MDDERKTAELESVSEHAEALRHRASEAELQHEKLTATLARVKAEKDAVDNVRRSVEQELERARVELSALRGRARGDDGHAGFEVEKLLAALGSTLDQVVAAAHPPLPAAAGAVGDGALVPAGGIAASSTGRASPSPSLSLARMDGLPLSERVDLTVRRLGDLRAAHREEGKLRRALEERCDGLAKEAAALRAAADDAAAQARRAQQAGADKDLQLKERARELADAQAELSRRGEELERLRQEDTSLGGTLEVERRARQKASQDAQAKDGELLAVRGELEAHKAAHAKAAEQLQATRQRLQEATVELEGHTEQLRLAKASNLKLNVTLEQLERGAEAEAAERHALERRLEEAEAQRAVAAQLRAQLQQAQDALSAGKVALREDQEGKQDVEGKLVRTARDLDGSRRALHAAEVRHAELSREKSALQAENGELRAACDKARERAEQEFALRMQTEATVEALRRASSESRLLSQDLTERESRAELQAAHAEEEKRTLRTSLVALKATYEEKDRERVSEANARKRAEAELTKCRAAVDKAQADLSVELARSKAVRVEGKRARKQVLDAVALLRRALSPWPAPSLTAAPPGRSLPAGAGRRGAAARGGHLGPGRRRGHGHRPPRRRRRWWWW